MKKRTIYVNNDLNASVIDNLCHCNPDIESLFVEISNVSKPVIYGVIYRPPNGKVTEFFDTLGKIYEALPKDNVHIMGDYNIDLLNHADSRTSTFEDLFIGNGYAPVISIATHERHNCKGSCIDNIFTNTIETVKSSGTLPGHRIGDHVPIFEISKLSMPKTKNSEKYYQVYEFSKNSLKILRKTSLMLYLQSTIFRNLVAPSKQHWMLAASWRNPNSPSAHQ